MIKPEDVIAAVKTYIEDVNVESGPVGGATVGGSKASQEELRIAGICIVLVFALVFELRTSLYLLKSLFYLLCFNLIPYLNFPFTLILFPVYFPFETFETYCAQRSA